MAFKKWVAQTPDGQVEWISLEPYIVGASSATYTVWADLLSYDETVDLSPVGPFLPKDPSNPYVVRYLVQRRWLDSTFSEEAPDLSDVLGDVPEDADA